MKILVINGPNINMLGKREPEIYGSMSLKNIEDELFEYSKHFEGVQLEFFQSNFEGGIVEKIQSTDAHGIIINPAAYTHTSVAILDALRAVKIPAVEVHLSNVNSRENYRKISYVAEACIGSVSGFKQNSYKMALFGLVNFLNE
ncbi:MAG: type II 3-dehydroquinate dehydratase [Candidatus Gastranaerophilales bacterium]|nr:type II 3-dehydroquinate dehydratase [Candidatus Gastranaerophilales bacterium]